MLADVWMTSRLVAVDMPRATVRTASGHDYGLRAADDTVMSPGLRDHLSATLHLRGYGDVRGC